MAPMGAALKRVAGVLLLLGVASLHNATATDYKVDVGIVVAVLGEYQALYQTLDKTPVPVNITKYGRTFTMGHLASRSVVVVACGIGMTNSAMTTQLLIDTFDATYIIFQGVAGGVNPSLRVGDVVIPQSWFNIHHQKLIRAVETVGTGKPTRQYYEVGRDFPNKFVLSKGYPVSLTASLPDAPKATPADMATVSGIPGVEFHNGFSIPMEMEVLIKPDDVFNDFPPTKFKMPVSATLFKIAKEVMNNGTLRLQRNATINGKFHDLGYDPKLVVTSNPGVSSSTFVDNKEYRESLYKIFKAQAAEMEGTAFMHVCVSCKKQCLVIRSLSDLAGGGADFVNVVQVFLNFASQNTAKVTKAILERLPA